MRSLTSEDFLEIIEKYHQFQDCETFIETGTYKGATIKNLLSNFKNLYTVEYSRKLYKDLLKEKFPNKVKLYNNNSEDFLKELLPTLTDKKLIFFLDAHWAGIETGFYKEDCPLLKELKIIKGNCKNALIIMDDFNKFGIVKKKEHYKDQRHIKVFGKNGKIEDWTETTLENVLNVLDTKDYKILKERLIIKI